MQFHRVSYLRRGTAVAFAGFLSSLVAAQTPATGVHARATPADYATSRQTGSATYAVSLIPADRVRHLFAVDISKFYLVFEVACYPSPAGTVTLKPADFLLLPASRSDFVHPAEASTIAAVIADENTPKPRSRGSEIVTEATIGYESGTDPYTGRPVHGVYTSGGVGVVNGQNDSPPPPPRPGASPQDRVSLENQLEDKSLPQGTFTAPVAGFLYFPADSFKKAKGNYQLEYLSDAAGKIDLTLSPKQK